MKVVMMDREVGGYFGAGSLPAADKRAVAAP
jgi:hypothetical protein